MTLIISFAAFMALLYMEKKCERKIHENSYIYHSRIQLLKLAGRFCYECRSNKLTIESAEMRASYYIDNPYEIYKEVYKEDLPELTTDILIDYQSLIRSVESAYISAYEKGKTEFCIRNTNKEI